jgi:hypothetical protein
MANTSKTYDASDDRSLYTLYRMGFESARVDHTTSRTHIRDYWGDDWEFRHMDGSRESRTQDNGEGRKMRKYFKRLWCALWNRKCHDDCDCV